MKTLNDIYFSDRINKIQIEEMDTECWEWNKGICSGGYGSGSYNGKYYKAHRLSYNYFIGDIKGLFVCHHCDNRKCINPKHLFLGTNKDNMDDMVRKGRQAWLGKKGILNPKSKKVNQYNLEGTFIKRWDSMMDIKRELGIMHGNISGCCLGKYKQARGFIWKYA